MSENSKFSAAIIGCGRIGCGFDDDPLRKTISTHAGAYNQNSRIKLESLCDIDENKLSKYSKKFSVENVFTNIDDLLERKCPDIISVCTLPSTHEEIVLKAVSAGVKNIFCEKPISDNIESAKNMVSYCKSNNVTLIIDHQRRFDPLNHSIKKIIDEGDLGQIRHCVSYYTAGIHNTGTHVIDLMRYFFGDAEWVIGSNSNIKSKNDDPNIDGLIKFENGVLASIHACNVEDYLIFEHDIIGSNGRIRILESGNKIEYYGIGDSKYFSGYKELDNQNIPFEVPNNKELLVEGVKNLIESFDTKALPLSTGYDGFATLQIIINLIESAKNNSKKILLEKFNV